MITRTETCLAGGVSARVLESVIDEFLQGAERYGRLKRYYMGHTDILKRERGPGLPNNKVAHAFARYIVTVTAGYLVGQPVEYETDGESAALDRVKRALTEADAPSVDIENARSAAIYGRGVELVTADNEGRPRMYALPAESAFVVYSSSIAHRPLFGVYLTAGTDEVGAFTCLKALVCTDSELITFEKRGGAWVRTAAETHFFGAVPMVEYWNDETETGDFEWVLPLIDAYDQLQSDRVNDKEQFTDRLLVLTGCTMDTDEEGRPPWLQLRMDKALCLPDGEAKAQYLSAQMDESGNEILRQSLADDIHKLSLVPDISDTQFSGNASGVAMKYKLLALEQLTGMKQQWFEEGLKTRLKLFANWLALRGGEKLDAGRVRCVFTRSLPKEEEG